MWKEDRKQSFKWYELCFWQEVKYKVTLEIHLKIAQIESLGQDPIKTSCDLIKVFLGMCISNSLCISPFSVSWIILYNYKIYNKIISGSAARRDYQKVIFNSNCPNCLYKLPKRRRTNQFLFVLLNKALKWTHLKFHEI